MTKGLPRPTGPQPKPPLDWPHEGISFAEAIKRGYRKWAVVDGRASFAEYWWFALFVFLVVVGLGGLDAVTRGRSASEGGLLSSIGAVFLLVNIVPLMTLGIRRLHDTGRSGWTYLYTFIPLVGGFIVFVWLCGSTRREAERFGPPLYSAPVVAPPPPSTVTGARTAGAKTTPAEETSAVGGEPVRSASLTRGPALTDAGAYPTLPPRKGRGPVLLIGSVAVIVLVGTAAAVWPLLSTYNEIRRLNAAGANTGTETTFVPEHPETDEPETTPAPTDPATPVWPTETPSESPNAEPTSSLDAPQRPDTTNAEVWQLSDGKPCSTSASKTTWGYPAATCHFWKKAHGVVTDSEVATGDHEIACQRDLGLDNPTYVEDQTNTWWVWARSDADTWDWFPETAIAQGASDQAINGIALCE